MDRSGGYIREPTDVCAPGFIRMDYLLSILCLIFE